MQSESNGDVLDAVKSPEEAESPGAISVEPRNCEINSQDSLHSATSPIDIAPDREGMIDIKVWLVLSFFTA